MSARSRWAGRSSGRQEHRLEGGAGERRGEADGTARHQGAEHQAAHDEGQNPGGGLLGVGPLEEVAIITTGDGPYLTDVFWLLIGRHRRSGCAVPSDAQGMDALLHRLQALPGFDNRTVVEAMGCTDDASFTCWRRASSGPASTAAGATSPSTPEGPTGNTGASRGRRAPPGAGKP